MKNLRCLALLANVALLAACAADTDGETVGTSGDAIETGDTVTLPTGTVPKKLTVITAAADCAKSTDCSRGWTDRFVDSVFRQHDPDIVIMTELFWNATYRNMVDQVGRVRPGVYNFYRGPKEGFFNGSGGTVIASRYVMTDKAEHEYVNAMIPDSFVDKGTAIARQHVGVLADGQPVLIDVLATHFQSKSPGVAGGNFTRIIKSQMIEQRDFLRWPAVWGKNGADGTANTTLKIYSGDLNVAGTGPVWLGGDDIAAGQRNFAWLRDNVFLPYGFRDSKDTCTGGVDRATACSTRAFVEKDPWDVVKQLHIPYAKLASGNTRDIERGMYMVPEAQQAFDTPSDHDAMQITYGLYVVTKRLQHGVEATPRRGTGTKVDAGAPTDE